MDARMGSARSPQNAQLTSITRSAGRLPNPARAPNPPAVNTALSRSVRNLSQIRLFIDIAPCHGIQAGSLTASDASDLWTGSKALTRTQSKPQGSVSPKGKCHHVYH